MDELLTQFLIEARDLIAQASDDLAMLAHDPGNRERIDSAFRAVHTLKGSVAIFDMAPAGRALHAAEDLLEQAQTGRLPLTDNALAALVAILDQADRWVDAMEEAGTLDAAAEEEADRLIAGFGSPGDAAGPAQPRERPLWLDTLLEREADAVDAAAGDLVAFRYAPDAESFFRGEDPLAIVAGVPDLAALAILPHASWPPLETFEPFTCAAALEGLSAAPLADVRAAARLAGDQVALIVVPAARADESAAAAQPDTTRSLRIDAARIDALADGVGELIVATNRLPPLADEADRIDPGLGARLRKAHGDLEQAVGAMHGAVLAVRMVSLGPSLRRLPRLVREIAQALGKSVMLDMAGQTTEVDKGIADALFEPLLHLVRNAIDHGIEPVEARRAAGKPEAGRLRLVIARDGNGVAISLEDDGAGIDPARIRETAVARGVLEREAADALDDAQALRLLFMPGFSTAEAVSAVSGRGVGMDAVQTVVEGLGGKVEIRSQPGTGTTIRLRLPLNAITTRLLIVRVGGDPYGIPLDRIIETASIPASHIVALGAGHACVLRDRTVPVLSLAALIGAVEHPSPQTKLLVTEASGEPIGLVVEGFGGRVDGLVRPKSGLLAAVPGIAGTTILSDGGVLIVLNLAELVP